MVFQTSVVKMIFLIIPILWLGCAALQNELKEVSGVEDHKHYLSKSQSFGDEHYHAVMKYDPQEGFLAIEMTDTTENSVKIIRANFAKAFLLLPGGERKEFHLINPETIRFLTPSRRAERNMHTRSKSNMYFTKKKFLKGLTAFSLKVRLPVKGTTYLIEYEYPELSNNDTGILDSR